MAKEGVHQALNRLQREIVALSQQVADRDAEIAVLKKQRDNAQHIADNYDESLADICKKLDLWFCDNVHEELDTVLAEYADACEENRELKARNHKLWCEECNASHAVALWEEHTKTLLEAARPIANASDNGDVLLASSDTMIELYTGGKTIVLYDGNVFLTAGHLFTLYKVVKAIEARHPELKATP